MTEDRVSIPGSERSGPSAKALDWLIEAEPQRDERIEITCICRYDVPTLERKLREIESQMPAKRRYLTHKELKGCAPSEKAFNDLLSFAAEHGLEHLGPRDAHRCDVRLAGARSAVEAAFGVKFRYYRSSSAEVRTYEGSASVPGSVSGVIQAVIGLERMVATESATSPQPAGKTPEAAPPDPAPPASDAPAAARGVRANARAEGALYTGTEISKLYKLPELRGKGQCVGIITPLGDFDDEDLKRYFAELKIKDRPTVTRVNPNERNVMALADFESTLDVEVAASICPGAHIVTYGTRNTQPVSYLTLEMVRDALKSAIFDEENLPSVLSMSFAFPEACSIDRLLGRPCNNDEEDLLNQLFLIAGCLGITICASSGDSGSLSAQGAGWPDLYLCPITVFPAASPLVLACGGTTLYANKGKIREEVVWGRLAQAMVVLFSYSQPFANTPATGGGVSRHYPLPDYQRKAQVPPAVTVTFNDGQLKSIKELAGRGVPDVAANADPLTGWKLVFRGKPAVGGGTSASTPFWAAYLTLINEGLSRTTGAPTRVGWVNPLLYALQIDKKKDVFRPIVKGSNGGYAAAPGLVWNACTGLGSPKGTKLAVALGVSRAIAKGRQ
ncbi:S53 family peptidase [Sorangium sp. So ce136]|uniref:S53 family peptidase n=1 Tax=Sorangium sp. So ce136 TaxID=3133284 RepID=UPI003F10E3DA